MAKTCRKCGEVKEAPAFPPNPRMRDGLHSWCRVCMAAAARSWRERHPERVAAYNEARRVQPREFSEADRQRLREQHRQAMERTQRRRT